MIDPCGRRTAPLVTLAAVFLLSGCSASDAVPTPVTTPTATPRHSPLSAYAREAASPDPYFDLGFTVHIRTAGFLPHQLVSPCCQPITWRNETGAPVIVAFDHLVVTSTPIPPGGTFVFTPKNVESITYHAAENPTMRGAVQVNPSTES